RDKVPHHLVRGHDGPRDGRSDIYRRRSQVKLDASTRSRDVLIELKSASISRMHEIEVADVSLKSHRVISTAQQGPTRNDHRLPRPLHDRTQGPASLPQGPDRGSQEQDTAAAARRPQNV